jgi:hypothetical protein
VFLDLPEGLFASFSRYGGQCGGSRAAVCNHNFYVLIVNIQNLTAISYPHIRLLFTLQKYK